MSLNKFFRKTSSRFLSGEFIIFAIFISIVVYAINSNLLVSKTTSSMEKSEVTPVYSEVVDESLEENNKDYKREYFGKGWLDTDHNGCDTRNDILSRDLDDVTYKTGTHSCVVESGTIGSDFYTGERIIFLKGQGGCDNSGRVDLSSDKGCSTSVQIDHVVPLKAAWDKGASNWTDQKREEFANDPLNLIAVDGSSNQEKGAKTIDEWLPEVNQTDYISRYIKVCEKYSLPLTNSEQQVIDHYLGNDNVS